MRKKLKHIVISVCVLYSIIFSISASETPNIEKAAAKSKMLTVLKGMQKAILSGAKDSSKLHFAIYYNIKEKESKMQGKYEEHFQNLNQISAYYLYNYGNFKTEGKFVINGKEDYIICDGEKEKLSKADIVRYKREFAIQYAPTQVLNYCSKIELDEDLYEDDDDNSYYLLALYSFSYEEKDTGSRHTLYVFVDTKTFLISEIIFIEKSSFLEITKSKIIENYAIEDTTNNKLTYPSEFIIKQGEGITTFKVDYLFAENH